MVSGIGEKRNSDTSISLSFSHAQDRFQAAVDICISGGIRRDADAHSRSAMPGGSAAPTGPSSWIAVSHGGWCRHHKGNQNLVQYHLIQYIITGGFQSISSREAWWQHLSIISAKPCLPNERSAAQISTPRARRDISGTYSSGSISLPYQISCITDHHGSQMLRLAYEDQTAIVGHIQPFVGIGSP
jgi:hypothetical protein